MFVRTSENKYYVGFEQDRRRPRATTSCKIFLMTDASGPTLVGRGQTLQGKKDVFNCVAGCRYALKRALADANFTKSTRELFWKVFHFCHRTRNLVTCREAFANIKAHGGFPRKLVDSSKAFKDEARRICAHRLVTKGSGLDWCTKHRAECSTETECDVTSESTPTAALGGLYSYQKRAMKRLISMSSPSGHGPVAFYEHHDGVTATTPLWAKPYSPKTLDHLKHEYHDDPYKGHAHGGVVGEFRKMYGLGWKKIINSNGETIWPRSKAQKNEQYRRFYGMADTEEFTGYEADYSKLERRVLRQQQQKVVIVNSPSSEILKQIFANKDRIKDIILDANERKKKMSWLRGTWPVADDRLTARMLSMSLKLTKKIDAKLLKRPGITKVLDDYIIDTDKFVPAFKVGEVVTYKGGRARVYWVDGPLVTLHVNSDGKSYEVFDHELEIRVHWLRRVGRALARMWGETAFDKAVRGVAEVPGRGLYTMIQNDYCNHCHGRGDFLQGPRGGSCFNVKCDYCGQKYLVDPMHRTATKI